MVQRIKFPKDKNRELVKHLKKKKAKDLSNADVKDIVVYLAKKFGIIE